MIDYIIIGKRIKEIRKSKGLTQAQLAEKIGINKCTLSVKMNGQYAFGNDEIIAICRVLGIPRVDISKYFFAQSVQKTERFFVFKVFRFF